ncbi:MAG: hypothetical protein AAF628_36700 [Planctomycetota bacterium]
MNWACFVVGAFGLAPLLPAAPQDPESAATFDRLEALVWESYGALVRGELVARDAKVMILPPLIKGRSSKAAEILVRGLVEAPTAPDENLLLYAENARNELLEAGLGTKSYGDVGDLARLAEECGCGVAIGGTIHTRRNPAGGETYELQWAISRPGVATAESTFPGSFDPDQMLRRRIAVEGPAVGYGANDNATDDPPLAPPEERASAMFQGFAAAARARAKEAGIRVFKDVGILPAGGGRLDPGVDAVEAGFSKLGDDFETKVRAGFSRVMNPKQVHGALQAKGYSSRWVLEEGVSSWHLDMLETDGPKVVRARPGPRPKQLKGLLEPSISLEGDTLVMQVKLEHRDGAFDHLDTRQISDAAMRTYLRDRYAAPSSRYTSLEDPPRPKPDLLLARALTSAMLELVETYAEQLDGKIIDFLPLQTDRTKEALERFSHIRTQLAQQRDVIIRAAKTQQLSDREALTSTDFPAKIPALRVQRAAGGDEPLTFPTWEVARSEILENLAVRMRVSDAYEAYRRLMETVRADVEAALVECGAKLLFSAAEMESLAQRMADPRRATTQLDDGSVEVEEASGEQPFNLASALPHFVIAAKALTVGDEVRVIVQLQAYREGVSKIVGPAVRRTIIDADVVTLVQNEGVDFSIATLLSQNVGGGEPQAVTAEPTDSYASKLDGLLADVQLVVLAEGKSAQRLADEIGEVYPGTFRSVQYSGQFDGWKDLAQEIGRGLHLRYDKGALNEEFAQDLAYRALEVLLGDGEAQLADPKSLQLLQRMRSHVGDVIPASVPVPEEGPVMVLCLRS